MKAVLLLFLAAALLLGATFKLYLKDGGYHMVREYQVQGERIRYFSTERGEWEEIPVDLVDLQKTERERRADAEQSGRQIAADDEEEKAERELNREIAAVPMEPGAYFLVNGKVEPLSAADYQIVTDKRRRVLQVISPVPIIPGKATVVIKGEHSRFAVHENRPSFYLRLAKQERFGIIRLTPKKDFRVVENISIIAVVKQAYEEKKQMDTFEQELADGLFRVWPEKQLEPGEYAMIEYAENGDSDEIQLLVWDFAVKT